MHVLFFITGTRPDPVSFSLVYRMTRIVGPSFRNKKENIHTNQKPTRPVAVCP